MLFFILPLMVLMAVYGHVAKKLWIHNAVDDVNIYTYICQHGKKKQTLKMLITVVLVYTICWLPLNLYLVMISVNNISERRNTSDLESGKDIAIQKNSIRKNTEV